jgi:energy-coupling factor transport system ATP-binding protein
MVNMLNKTFLGLYRRKNIFPLEFKFILMVGLCTFFSFNGYMISKIIIFIIMLGVSIILGKMRSIMLMRILLISCIILLIFWAFFSHGVNVHSFISDFYATIISDEYINAVFRLFGLIIPGYIFMGITSEQELLSTLRRYKAKPEVTIFFIVTFNTFSHFISVFRTISFGYKMRITHKKNIMNKLVHILTTLLFNCISLIICSKKVYYLYEDRIKNVVMNNFNDIDMNILKKQAQELRFDISQVKFNDKELYSLSNLKASIFIGKKTLLYGDVGSGKTTLLNIISGIIPNIFTCEYVGYVHLDGTAINNNDVDFVFQHAENSMFYDTVDRQLAHIQKDVRQYWLEKFRIDDLNEKAIVDLSIGQKKIISILSCLLSESSICLLDEPTAHLDNNAIDVFLNLLNSICQYKIIIVVSHDKSIYLNFDNFIKLDNFNHITKKTELKVTSNMPKTLSVKREVLVNVEHCTYKYQDGTVVFNDLCFEINKGEIIGLLGMNGSGKSTISHLLVEASNGSYKDNAIKIYHKCSIAMMLQDTDMQFFTTNVSDELRFGLIPDDNIKAKTIELIQLFNLKHLKNEPPQFLSEGQKKMLLVTCLLLSRPDILILDEPFDSLDMYGRNALVFALLDYIHWTNHEKSIIINDQNNAEISGFVTRYINLPGRHYKKSIYGKDIL